MQLRETGTEFRTPVEAFLARADAEALDYLTGCLMDGRPIVPGDTPAPGERPEAVEVLVEG
jgi:hypothetical protein